MWAARRSEAAAKMVQDHIRGNLFLRWMQMREIPAALLIFPAERNKAKAPPKDFL
ncbi:unnamed protein product [Effrenium voratum]|uniref:Uncharacterized protein n=1 Tax=Effrenium voratum TaxID=2562239 RepID=A0AA36MQ15_9DINO|nr:unnamed protein product [Effrenium voratum]